MHLNGIFLTGNFAWAFARPFVNYGQKDRAKFPNFDPCTVCGKTLPVSGGVYLPAFWATPLCTLMPAFWATPPTVTVKLQALVLYNCNKGVWPKKQALMYKGVWPKKQVNKPLLKPAMFCHTLCRGQNLKILPSPFDHCSQNVWWTPTQNWWSKRCCLGDPIPIWSWTKLSKSYGMYHA